MSDFKTSYKPSGKSREELLELTKQQVLKDVDHQNSRPGNLNKSDGYDCQKCLNRGYVIQLEPDEISTRAVACECMKVREKIHNANRSGLGDLIKKRWNDYRTDAPWQLQIKQAAKDFVDSPSGWFVVCGQPGSGKTLICGIVSAYLLGDGKIVELKSWPELVREANTDWFREKNQLERYKSVEVLFLDDFLKQSIDTRSLQIAYEILNYRYNYNKLTIISGELTMSELWKIDEALASRIKERSGNHLMDVGRNQERNLR